MKFDANQKVQYLKLSEIDAAWDDRARGISENGVEGLITSIEENGFTTPISVRRKGRGENVKYVLIAGGHRLTAVSRLGWDTIPALVFSDITDLRAKFMELADNLAGKRLDALEEVAFLSEWQQIFLEAHPEAKRGFAGVKSRQGELTANLQLVSFVRAAAEATGYSERKIYSRVALGKALAKKDLRALQSAPIKVKAGDLDTLAKLKDTKSRDAAIQQFADGEVASLGEAIKQLKPSKPSPDPDEKALSKLVDAWGRAPLKVKRRFVEKESAGLFSLLNGLDGEL